MPAGQLHAGPIQKTGSAPLSSYELQRAAKIQQNRGVLRQLGVNRLPSAKRSKRCSQQPVTDACPLGPVRQSSRLKHLAGAVATQRDVAWLPVDDACNESDEEMIDADIIESDADSSESGDASSEQELEAADGATRPVQRERTRSVRGQTTQGTRQTEQSWMQCFQLLLEWRDDLGHGAGKHCNVPRDTVYGGMKLGRWLDAQRTKMKG